MPIVPTHTQPDISRVNYHWETAQYLQNEPILESTNIFGKEWLDIQLSRNKFETEILNILKNYNNPNATNALYSSDDGRYEEIAATVKHNFKQQRPVCFHKKS